MGVQNGWVFPQLNTVGALPSLQLTNWQIYSNSGVQVNTGLSTLTGTVEFVPHSLVCSPLDTVSTLPPQGHQAPVRQLTLEEVEPPVTD